MQAFDSLKFLQHPQCTVVKSFETEAAKIVCLDKKVSVSYPVPHFSYQMHLTYLLPEYQMLDGYTVEPNFVIVKKGDSEILIEAKGSDTVLRLDKILERFNLLKKEDLSCADFKIVQTASGALHLLALIPREKRSVLVKITDKASIL